MRILPPAVTSHLSSGGQVGVHALIWITARNRSTNAMESLGLWTGADVQTVTVDGVDREYHGAGTLLDLDPIQSAATTQVREWSFRVSSLSEGVISAVRLYDARLAPVEVHEWFWDPVGNVALADPIRVFRGTVMTVDLPVPALGQEAVGTITCVSDAWRLTRGLTLKRSHEALLERTAGADTFRQYNSLVGVPVVWGEVLITSGDNSLGGGFG